jgi:hypothetical protein
MNKQMAARWYALAVTAATLAAMRHVATLRKDDSMRRFEPFLDQLLLL